MSSSSTLELVAPAKLNLFLEVLGRRPDGYHEIDSVMVAVDLCDRIRIERADEISLSVPGGGAPEDATNLAWRAAEALGVAAAITIEKRIPAGAGLGGGSSDAAAVLRGLDRLYGLGLSKERLNEVAIGLGADVPFFLHGGTARCRGIGERVEPVENPPRKRFLVVAPSFPTATAEVYAGLDAGLKINAERANFFVKQYLGGANSGPAPYFNRLQETAERLDGRLARVREAVEAQFGSAFTLTGSGSSYFAEFGEGFRGKNRLEWRARGSIRVFETRTF